MPPLGGIALLCLLPIAAVAKDGPYLTWGAKNAPIQQAGTAAQIPVPPSPYGQVGDPYLHVLSWGAKSGSAQPSRSSPSPQAARPQPAPTQRMAEPVQAYARPPQAPTYHPAPQYSAQPVAQPRPQPEQGQALQSLPAPPAVRQPTLAAQSQPRAPAKTPAQAPVPAPAATPDDGAYQVPANSPYAARIAAARAAQAKAGQARAEPSKTEAKATKPAAANASQAAQDQAAVTGTPAEDDKPFVPGEHYTDASEAPRLYSLHRSYGLKPDPITVDSNPSGAVLDTSHLDAAEAKVAKDDKASADDEDDNRYR